MINGMPIMTAAQKRMLHRTVQSMRQVNLDYARAEDEKVRRDLPAKYAVNIGDGADTTFTVTHGLKTRDVMVQVRLRAAPYTYQTSGFSVDVDSVNSVSLTFSSAPSANEFRVIVIG